MLPALHNLKLVLEDIRSTWPIPSFAQNSSRFSVEAPQWHNASCMPHFLLTSERLPHALQAHADAKEGHAGAQADHGVQRDARVVWRAWKAGRARGKQRGGERGTEEPNTEESGGPQGGITVNLGMLDWPTWCQRLQHNVGVFRSDRVG